VATWWRDHRVALEKSSDEAAIKNQTTVFQLATGTLALSVTFRDAIAGPAKAEVGWLVAAWICLTLSVLAHVNATHSRHVTDAALAMGARDMEDKYGLIGTRAERQFVGMSRLLSRDQLYKMHRRLKRIFDTAQGTGFTAGVVCLAVFAIRAVLFH
jgi:hypothetical protein